MTGEVGHVVPVPPAEGKETTDQPPGQLGKAPAETRDAKSSEESLHWQCQLCCGVLWDKSGIVVIMGVLLYSSLYLCPEYLPPSLPETLLFSCQDGESLLGHVLAAQV